jgi:uncharacterized protein YehS (DUF1456 family)
MNTNDVLRAIRYSFNLGDSDMMNVFRLAGGDVTRAQVCDWLKKEEDEAFQRLSDFHLAVFLNGFIILRRGKKDGELPIPEKRLNNNITLRKLKIALNLKDDDMLQIFEFAGRKISKHELSAFFRNPDQEQYRECKDQLLRNFLQGMKKKYHVDKASGNSSTE